MAAPKTLLAIPHGILTCAALIVLSSVGFCQTENSSVDLPSATYDNAKIIEMRIGVRISSADGNMHETSAQTVFPTDWPEQTVEVLQISASPNVQVSFRDLPGNNKQMLVFAPFIPSGSTIEAIAHLRITKSHITAPASTDRFKIPRRANSKLKMFMGSSPYIDPGLSEVRRVVKEIQEQEPGSDWKRVEMLYDWVQQNIAYENGEMKTIQKALKDRKGDCEEMTGIFVALCRAAKIPSRCVWIPNHCYPEFYLEDESGEGHWFPCQAAGTRNFGNMPEHLPILQKGDRFKVPEKREVLRYLADHLTSQNVTGKGKPKVEFVRQLLGDAALLPTLEQTGEPLRETTEPPPSTEPF